MAKQNKKQQYCGKNLKRETTYFTLLLINILGKNYRN